MKNSDILLHVKGLSQFVDDLPHPGKLLFGAVVPSKIAHGRILKIDVSLAEKIQGVVKVFTAKNVPGKNQIGNVIQDEPLFADETVHYVGQPIALVTAHSPEIARIAADRVDVKYKPLPAVFDAREAFAKGKLIAPPRTFSLGDVEAAWSECVVIVEGKVESGGQEHVYLETQGSLAVPTEKGIKISSATQAASVVQRIAARILDIPMHFVEVDVPRLGGAFGGKEDQATSWACMAALAAWDLRRPVKLVLCRRDDIRMTGKRHPYSSDFKMGLAKDGRILAYEAHLYQNAGACTDLSLAILERTLFHCTNSYYIPNVKVTATSCRTNLPPNTAFRGFGAPQAMFLLESAICKAADALGFGANEIQQKNLLRDGDVFPYGMEVANCTARRAWKEAEEKFDVKAIQKNVAEFNTKNARIKKGVALMPICFGISFTSTALNQASALAHIYTDGSIIISTAAVEMGQGVNAKIAQVAAKVFSIDSARIKVESTNTARIANMSPTAASTGPDLNGNATRIACESILARLKEAAAAHIGANSPNDVSIVDERVLHNGKPTQLKWNELVMFAYTQRKSLSAHAHYATPNLHFDKATNTGRPFAYHVFGTAIVTATVDCLRGTYSIDSVKIAHDAGKSLDPLIDRGQMEGGVTQGIGWMTIEEVLHSTDGRLISDSLSTYKVSDMSFAPREIITHFLENADNLHGILNSKAIGEPPFMYGIGAYFAILNAMRAFRPDLEPFFTAPMTNERVLMKLFQ